MATIPSPDRLTFSPDSLEFRDHLRERLTERLRELAADHARSEGRDRVTRDDFKAMVRQAVMEIMEEMEVDGGVR